MRAPRVRARSVGLAASALMALSAVAPAGAQAPPPPEPGSPPRPPPPLVQEGPGSAPRPLYSAAAVEVAAATTVRAFGRQPYQDVVAAASAEARARRAGGCALSGARLAGVMLSVTFTEAGPLSSSTVAPSPMTLSRWDGTAPLWSFGTTATPYRTAFWHPGIGMWQFDHPWQNTAAERIDTAASARLAAQVMAGRYCGWTSGTGLTRFAYMVRPWHGCNATTGAGDACRAIFLNHFVANSTALSDDRLTGFTLVDGVGRLGGARWRTCRLLGQTATVPCLYVHPGLAQGYRGWASSTFSPNPLSSPFYVVRVGSTERRYWLREDTGYAIDIAARTTIGSNPRSTIAWASGGRICDVSALRGGCELRAPSWKRWRYDQVTGTYTPLVGDFDGNGRDDIFWYGPGAAADGLWLTRRDGAAPVKLALRVTGTYRPLVGDFDGNGRDDIFWYGSGSAPDGLWLGAVRGAFQASTQAVGGRYAPLVGDFDGNRRSDILWYAPADDGSSPERLWLSRTTGGFAVSGRAVPDGFRPFVGDFDGDARDDIFWYAPGSVRDSVWFGAPAGAFASSSRSVGGTYRPLVGDFDADGRDDVVWYASGFASDWLWSARAGRTFESRGLTVNGAYAPVVGDISGNRRADIVWYAPGTAGDAVWLGAPEGAFTSDRAQLSGRYRPLVGDFDATAGRDVFWYAAGAAIDGMWFD
jgi:hypothetical protein